MAAVDIRELARNTSKVIGDVARRNRPTLITRGGRPVAALIPIDADAVDDWILANSPDFVRGMQKADQELGLGQTVGMDEAFGTLGQRARRARGGAAKRAASAKTVRS